MGKLLLISFNLFIIIISKLYFGGDVNVNQQFPEYVKPGETFQIQVEIEKGDREGFAKWQQKLPEGFTAEIGKTEGGTFSFKNQEIKVIWMALPKAEKFTVSYQLKTDAALSGEFELDGKFSYIEENERKVAIAGKKKLTVSTETPELADVDSEESNESNTMMDEDAMDIADEQRQENIEDIPEEEVASEFESPISNTMSKNVLDKDNVQITRSITHMGDGFYEVDLEINKDQLESFGKIEEFIPPDFTASALESSEGIFSFSKNVMKIMWMTLPKGEQINITYGLQSTSDELDSSVVFGVFSFLEVDESRQLKLAGSKFRNFLAESDQPEEELTEVSGDSEPSVEDEEMMNDQEEVVEETMPTTDFSSQENGNNGTTETPVEEVDEIVEAPLETEVVNDIEEIEPEQKEVEKELIESVTNIPAPETSISYRVQIAASKREVQQQYFTDRHNIREEVTIQSHEGWYKYTVGSYNVYKAARDRRNEIWGADNKINDAFVTAYNEGVRISVQEALMVSKQKWYN